MSMADKLTWRNAGLDGDPVIQCTGHYNWMKVKQPIPISLNSFPINSKLMHAHIMHRDFMEQY